jgi:hypothetical protein
MPSGSNNFLLWIKQLAIRDGYKKDTLLVMLDEVKVLMFEPILKGFGDSKRLSGK